MCGILGFSRSNRSKVTDAQWKTILSVLISHMDLRGGDSYGYYNGNGEIFKGIGTGAFGAQLDDLQSLQTLMFHTRKATVGAITAANAHPWRFRNIVGMHNGGVANHLDLCKKYNRAFNVDSMHIFANYAEDLPLYELRAHGAIAFVDELHDPSMLWTSRFNEGILTIVGIGENRLETTDIVFCSLPFPIKLALDLAKVPDYVEFSTIQRELYHIKDGSLFSNQPEVHLQFSPKNVFGEERYAYNLTCKQIPRLLPLSMGPKAPVTDSAREVNVQVGTVVEYPKPPVDQELNVKNFVRNRTGLEAIYYNKPCSYCDKNTAIVRVPCTEMLYCASCWEKLERIAPFLLDKADHDLWLNEPGEEPEITASAVDDEEEDETLCERCSKNPAAYMVTKEEKLICHPCKQRLGYRLDEIVILDIGDAIRTTVSTGDDLIPTAQPDGTGCQVDCGNPGRVHYFSQKHKKHLWLCLGCMGNLLAEDEKLRARPIRIIGFAPAIALLSARNPKHIPVM